eukprot:9385694-Ditylum_brightwellii.AAC.1
MCLILQSSSIEDEFIHIKGHQDDETPYEQLDLPARMNIDVNFLAVDFRTRMTGQSTKVT